DRVVAADVAVALSAPRTAARAGPSGRNVWRRFSRRARRARRTPALRSGWSRAESPSSATRPPPGRDGRSGGSRPSARPDLLEVGDTRHHVMALGRVTDLRLLEAPLRLFLVAHQLLHRVPDRVRGRVGRVERDEDELVAERAQLLEGEWMRILVPAEGGRVVEGQRQVRMRLAHRLGEGHRRLARRVRQLAPDQVHARVGVGAAATDRLFEAPTDGTVGVGPGDDDEVAVEAIARVDGRAVLPQRLLETDD